MSRTPMERTSSSTVRRFASPQGKKSDWSADTVRDAAESAFEQLHKLHVQQHALFDEMAHASGDQLEKLMRRHAEVEAAIDAAGGYAIDHRVDAMLHGLGFADEQF